MLSLSKLYELLGTPHIAGTPEQLQKLCIRIGELAEMNGEGWVRSNRRLLLKEWEYALRQGYVQ